MKRRNCILCKRWAGNYVMSIATHIHCTRHFSSTTFCHHAWLPRRFLLIRHGESAANVDRQVYSHLPDWRIPLTERGRAQSLDCGRRLRKIIKDEKLYIYYSPYERARQTLEEIRKSLTEDQIQGEREDERLREQEMGNFQPWSEMDNTWAQRNAYGRLYYRFPSGESGADVGNRVCMFFDSLQRERVGLSIPNMNEGVMLDRSHYTVPPFPSDNVYLVNSKYVDKEKNMCDSNADNIDSVTSLSTSGDKKRYTSFTEEESNKGQSRDFHFELQGMTPNETCIDTSSVEFGKCNRSMESEANNDECVNTNYIAHTTRNKNDSNSSSLNDEEGFNSVRNKRDSVWSAIEDDHNVVIVSHGLLIRLFISRWYHLSTEVFETMCNPPNCSIIVMERNDKINTMVMTDISKELFGSDPLLQMIRFDGVEDAEWHKQQLRRILFPDQYTFDHVVEDDDENHYSKSTAHNTAVGAPAPPRRLSRSVKTPIKNSTNNILEEMLSVSNNNNKKAKEHVSDTDNSDNYHNSYNNSDNVNKNGKVNKELRRVGKEKKGF